MGEHALEKRREGEPERRGSRRPLRGAGPGEARRADPGLSRGWSPITTLQVSEQFAGARRDRHEGASAYPAREGHGVVAKVPAFSAPIEVGHRDGLGNRWLLAVDES